ncbi:hypothetical protein BC628DRAFT_912537 [Trametes gibbosa]|nr:hypothetical protein BC628DRAFT_912537 [Trametes gibbosa]
MHFGKTETYINSYLVAGRYSSPKSLDQPNTSHSHLLGSFTIFNMRFSAIVALVTSVALVSATPSPAVAASSLVARSGDGSIELTKRSGCGSTGPLGDGHFIWWITAPCTPGTQKTCQVTDKTGCLPGETSKIGSVEVDNPDDTTQIAKKSGTNTLPFTCPPGGQVRCQANFNDNDDGPSYSLRVF